METEAQRGEVIHPRSHSQESVELALTQVVSPQSPNHSEHPRRLRMMCSAHNGLGSVGSAPPAHTPDMTSARLCPACRAIRAAQDMGKRALQQPPTLPHVTRSPIPTRARVHVSGWVCSPSLSPSTAAAGLAPGQTLRLGAAMRFYKPWESGALVVPWQPPGYLGTLEPLTHTLKPHSSPTPTPHPHLALATHAPTTVSLPGSLPAWCQPDVCA